MTVVEKDESSGNFRKSKSHQKTSEGSVANSIVGISELGGGSSTVCGKFKEDDLGIEFIKDIEKAKVRFCASHQKMEFQQLNV